MKYTKEILEQAVKESFSMADVLRKCGAPNLAGGTSHHVSKRIKEYGISTSHFIGKRWHLGKPSLNRREADSYLVYHADLKRQRAKVLVRSLLDIGRPYKCYVCGLREWRGKKLILEIEHKDGNFQNDVEENLEFICPNCHSQTLTFSRRKDSKQFLPPKLRPKRQGREVRHPSSDGYWRTRDKPRLRKVDRPSPVELQSLLQTLPMIKIGEKFGVSDNAVRKWIRRYGMEMPKVFGRSRGNKDVRV
jgi:predicted RNA-binding Zn-ribbon protein involved in translation (DUF1610 family)